MEKCLVCGFEVKRAGRTFCSRACAQTHKSNGNSITKDCSVCGVTFRRKISQAGPTCSRECRAAARKRPPAERFWSQVEKTESCWLWQGGVSGSGYGVIHVSGTKAARDIVSQSAHRFSWELHHGPIQDDLNVLHDCPDGDNPLCVNPAHLWLGTVADNMTDKVRKLRQCRGSRHGNSKLDEEQVRFILASGETGAELSRRFGVSAVLISRIRSRQVWTHVK